MRFPALHHELAGMMVELRGMQTPDHAQVVRRGGEVREEIGEPHARLAVLLELAPGAQESGALLLQKGEAHLFEDGRIHSLATEFIELRFVVEEIYLRGRTGHEDKDAAFCPGCEVGEPTSCGSSLSREHVRECQSAQTTRGCGQEVPAGPEVILVRRHHDRCFY